MRRPLLYTTRRVPRGRSSWRPTVMTLTLGGLLVLAMYRVLCVIQWHDVGDQQLSTVDPVDASTALEHLWGGGVTELAPDEKQRSDQALVAGQLVEGGEQAETEEEEGDEGEVAKDTAVDTAEQRTPRERERSRWAVPPKTTLVNPPAKLSSEARPELKFHCDRPGCTFKIKLDNSEWLSVTSPLRFRNPLADGWHLFKVAAVDMDGQQDPQPVEAIWKLDTTPPKTFLDVHPVDPSPFTSATFEVGTNERCTLTHTFDMRQKGSAQWHTLSPKHNPVNVTALSVHRVRFEVGRLKDVQYRFTVTAQDTAGNAASPAVFEWMVDTVAPETVIHTGPDELHASQDATFIISADGEDVGSYGFQYRINGGSWSRGDTSNNNVVGSGYEFTLRDLREGPTTVDVRTVDRAGNADPTPVSYSFTVHVNPADTMIESGPRLLDNHDHANFTVRSSETQYTYAYWLDGSKKAVRPQGHQLVTGHVHFTVAGLREGPHVLLVRATDVTGAEDPTPATYKWTVDLTPPTLQILERPKAVTIQRDATFAVNASKPNVLSNYRLDKGHWEHIDPSRQDGVMQFTLTELYEGRHTLELNCTDTAGNVGGAAAVEWVVDEGPPKVRFLQTPEKHSHRRVAAFHLQAGEGDCTYEYRLDRKGWHSAQHGTDVTFDPRPHEAHVSGALFTLHTMAGFHVIEIRATDATGNRDVEPATFEWVVY